MHDTVPAKRVDAVSSATTGGWSRCGRPATVIGCQEPARLHSTLMLGGHGGDSQGSIATTYRSVGCLVTILVFHLMSEGHGPPVL